MIFTLSTGYAVASKDEVRKERDFRKEYEDFRQKANKEYADFRDKANAEYAEFIRQAWKRFGVHPPVPAPSLPGPPKPPVAQPDEKPANDSIPFEAVVPPATPVTPPQPLVPIPADPIPVLPSPETTPPDVPLFAFSFYNTDCRIRLDDNRKIPLPAMSKDAIADAWETLSAASYNPAIVDCLHLREELNLCDWGYYQLVKTIADKHYGADRPNESTLLQVFILTQSGYKVRMARTDSDHLAVLIPFEQAIYSYTYLSIDDQQYYVMDKSLKNSQFYVCEHAFPQEQIFSLQINSLPKFNYAPTAPKALASEEYPVKVEIKSNQNLIDFFDSYPLSSEWNLYAKTSLSEQVKEQLYPVLKSSISGKSRPEAANLLINFVQTAFDYLTDDEQFGYERPFFGDETLYYPACDCEDRAILFAILVKELLDMDVVLLVYSEHMATAVRFDEDVAGDYLTVEGQKYIVCDPTYIGAPIGLEMPSYKGTKTTIVRIWKR